MGGNAFTDVGTIHKDEISPTLDYIALKTQLTDIHGRALGSVGKKEYSGDIDLVVEPRSPEEMVAFVNKLKTAFGETGVRKIGALITTKVPIQKYEEHSDARQPRTGWVQVDYMFGNKDWYKLYFHSPAEEESALKGTHRNIAIATLAGFTNRQASNILDDYERPVQLKRYKWSPRDGLVRVFRTSRWNTRTDTCIKKQDEEILSDAVQDADEIAEILFKGQGTADDLNSAESIIKMITQIYDVEIQEDIFKQMARNFLAHHDIGKVEWNYPQEIQQYIEDKHENK